MTFPFKLIYGHDPVCGWCYSFIPAPRALAERYPHLPIELVMGGLFSGAKVRPYADMLDYITGAFGRIKAKTGRHADESFFDMIVDPKTGAINSTPPCHALLQMRALTPMKLADYAHALQEVHYENGRSFNDPNVFNDVARALGLPEIDQEAALAATEDDPIIREEYKRAKALNVSTYPTSLVLDSTDNVIGRIESVYDPEEFIREFERIIA